MSGLPCTVQRAFIDRIMRSSNRSSMSQVTQRELFDYAIEIEVRGITLINAETNEFWSLYLDPKRSNIEDYPATNRALDTAE
jgi:hypothetical protein